MSNRLPLLALSLLFAACDAGQLAGPAAEPPASTAQASKADKSSGLFRIESPMFPFYSRTESPASVGGFGYRTDEWATITFYRDPNCVPAGFNLFDFYDIPGAFFCPSLVDGFSLHVEPMGMTPPKMSNLSGNAVAIWFVPWDAPFQQAVANGSLTIADLEAMPGLLKGVATQFRETLNSVENHPVPKIIISARGDILPEYGGGSFRYNVSWQGLTVETVRNVKIDIR
jgi:hypothetical protein